MAQPPYTVRLFDARIADGTVFDWIVPAGAVYVLRELEIANGDQAKEGHVVLVEWPPGRSVPRVLFTSPVLPVQASGQWKGRLALVEAFSLSFSAIGATIDITATGYRFHL